jgi:MerR family transcriptional regulator, redox-sensitive transcriptional activator SoxR
MESLSIGELADRAGVATSALRFYESKGLIESERTSGNQRRYPRATLRRVSLIRAAQEVGLSLSEVAAALETLPHDRTPTKKDWERLSRSWREHLDRQISELENLRDELTDCIGCGCLSLKSCAIFNPSDVVAARGSGPRYLLGDERVGQAG